jgi:hypothetical protein
MAPTLFVIPDKQRLSEERALFLFRCISRELEYTMVQDAFMQTGLILFCYQNEKEYHNFSGARFQKRR